MAVFLEGVWSLRAPQETMVPGGHPFQPGVRFTHTSSLYPPCSALCPGTHLLRGEARTLSWSHRLHTVCCQDLLYHLSITLVLVLVYSAAVNKNATDWGAYTISLYFSQFWRVGSPRSRCQQTWCLMRAHCVLIVSVSCR